MERESHEERKIEEADPQRLSQELFYSFYLVTTFQNFMKELIERTRKTVNDLQEVFISFGGTRLGYHDAMLCEEVYFREYLDTNRSKLRDLVSHLAGFRYEIDTIYGEDNGQPAVVMMLDKFFDDIGAKIKEVKKDVPKGNTPADVPITQGN